MRESLDFFHWVAAAAQGMVLTGLVDSLQLIVDRHQLRLGRNSTLGHRLREISDDLVPGDRPATGQLVGMVRPQGGAQRG